MKLIIARHGEAESSSATGLDKDRKLTDKGRLDLVKMADFIYHGPLRVSQIFHSPYLRTRETAETFAERLQFKGKLVSANELLPSNDYGTLCPKLSQLTNSDTVMLIGHNPDVSFFAARLIREESISRSLIFSPGTTIAINIAKENFEMGQIIWIISPDFLKS